MRGPDLVPKLIVFAGPSLPKSVRPQFSQTVFLPPAEPGDIYQILSTKPDVILILDGSPLRGTCRHKEILFALNRGVKVVGAAGLGAIRAAELHEFGMLGIGDVFNWLMSKKPFFDTDEVISHCEVEGDNYLVKADSLVNWRFRFNSASQNEQELIDRLKTTYYQKRTATLFPKLANYNTSQNVQHDDAVRALKFANELGFATTPIKQLQIQTMFQKRDILAAMRTLGLSRLPRPLPPHTTNNLILLSDLLRITAEFVSAKWSKNSIDQILLSISEEIKSTPAESKNGVLWNFLHPLGIKGETLGSRPEASYFDRFDFDIVHSLAGIWAFLEKHFLTGDFFTNETINAVQTEFLHKRKTKGQFLEKNELLPPSLIYMLALVHRNVQTETLVGTHDQFLDLDWVQLSLQFMKTKPNTFECTI